MKRRRNRKGKEGRLENYRCSFFVPDVFAESERRAPSSRVLLRTNMIVPTA